ncbi:MAG: NADH:flavin oxidoreductase [Myxococcota bacterium]|nr:NADH:flavin oxidoreductase [Myxococcota bacterium]
MSTQSKRTKHSVLPTKWPSEAEAQASRLFQPVMLGKNTRLAHRTWVPAMVPWRATQEGEVTDELLEWYGRFAEGQPGAIVVEATGIRDIPSGPLLRIGHERYIPGLRRLVEVVRSKSRGQTRLLIQLIDFLAVKRRPEPQKFFSRYLEVSERHKHALCDQTGDRSWLSMTDAALTREMPKLSVSTLEKILTPREFDSLQNGYRERVSDMQFEHIRNLPERLPGLFSEAALRAEKAGFDGVELHFAHAYTMASFLSALNSRNDGYGATLQGRVKLPLEVYSAVRSRLDSQTSLGCRMLSEEAIAGGSTVEDATYFAVQFAKSGMDFISLSRGGKFEDAKQPRIGHAVYPYTGPSGHECMPTVYSDKQGPFGRQLKLAHQIRDAVRAAGYETPIVAAGGINSFELAEHALASGAADIIAAARQSLADPDWFLKMRLGRGSEIRRCMYTNYCEGLDQSHKQVTCQLWDRKERTSASLKSHDGKRWLVAPPWIRSSKKKPE